MRLEKRPTAERGFVDGTSWMWSIGLACLVAAVVLSAHAQEAKPRATVGAYYFDGWSGPTKHVTKLLETKYADRKPVWGWYDDTVEIMQKQIELLCGPWDCLLAVRLVLPGGQKQNDAPGTTLSNCTEGRELPAIEVLPTRGEPSRLSHRAEGLGRLLPKVD